LFASMLSGGCVCVVFIFFCSADTLHDPCDSELQPLCDAVLPSFSSTPAPDDSEVLSLFRHNQPSSKPPPPRRPTRSRNKQIEGHPDSSSSSSSSSSAMNEVLTLAYSATKTCNILFTAEVIAALLYSSLLVFFLVDIFYDLQRPDDTGALNPLAALILTAIQLGFCALWCLSFFCHYGVMVVHLRNVHARHYQSIHRHLRVTLVFSAAVFLLAVATYVQWQGDSFSSAFGARYSNTCRTQPLVPPACPTAQLLMLWNSLRVLVIGYLWTLVGQFHDSYAAHRYPALIKAFPDHAAASNVRSIRNKGH